VAFYNTKWDTIRWRMFFRIFFSRFVMGRAGRDPEFFRYVEGSVAARILSRTRHALTALATHDNPFLNFILTGSFGAALPYYARKEHFTRIRNNLDRLELCCGTTDTALKKYNTVFDLFNLSDIFEYMDEMVFGEVAESIIAHATPRARLIYWNMLVPRQVSAGFPEKVTTLTALSDELFLQDKAFFYQAFSTDEVRQ
jgi:S-adenosylmethionine-diacylglycerol 3-amino-3-carboxypropyl transferase